MKVLIDIPEGIYKTLCKNSSADIVRQAVIEGTPLSEGATNGDVIKAVFPNADISLNDSCFEGVVNRYGFDQTWWNAPYKAESEDKE